MRPKPPPVYCRRGTKSGGVAWESLHRRGLMADFDKITVNSSAQLGASGHSGDLVVRDAQDREVLHADGATAGLRVGIAGSAGHLLVRDGKGKQVFHLDGEGAGLLLGADGNDGDIRLYDSKSREAIHLDAAASSLWIGVGGGASGKIILRKHDGTDAIT